MGCCCSISSERQYSAKVNPRFSSEKPDGGLVEERGCTDICFFILFVAYITFLLLSVGIAASRGDPRRLIYGVDRYGNICGVQNEKIPSADRSGENKTGQKFLVLDTSCSAGTCAINKSCEVECPEGYKKTTLRRCLPMKIRESAEKVTSALPWLEEIGSDITLCWPHIVLLCGISVGLSVVLMLVFRYCASIIIWAVLIVVALAAIALVIFLWVTWHQNKSEVDQLPEDVPGRELEQERVRYWLIAAIVATIATVIYLFVVFIMRKRIGLVAALFKEAGKALGAMPFILLQPIWTFLAEALVCFFLLIGFIILQSSGVPQVDDRGDVTFPIHTFFQVARWLILFGFLWMTQFIFACQHLVVAGAVSNWYFTRNKDNLKSPILRSLKNLVLSHLGSACLGSLVIALVQAVRAILRIIQKNVGEKGEKCQILWKMVQCCLACFESYLKFLSRNAYIIIAMYGESFCTSARRAFALISANVMRVAALESIGDFVLFVGKVGVTVAIAFIGLEIVKGVEGVHYVWVPVGVACAFAYISCHCFLSVYEMAIDTLLLNFCDDCESNDGVNRPYYMSRSLMVFVENSRRTGKVRPAG